MKQIILIAFSLVISTLAFAQNETPVYNFHCQAGLDNKPPKGFIYVNEESPNDQIHVGYGIVVYLSRIDNNRFLIDVKNNGTNLHPPTIVDGRRTSMLAMTSTGATLVCYSYLKK